MILLLPRGVVVLHRHFLVVSALRAGEVSCAPRRVGGDDRSLVIVVDVAAFLTLLAVGNHRAPLAHDDSARNLYRQRITSEKASVPVG
jgi:hypothetical protein